MWPIAILWPAIVQCDDQILNVATHQMDLFDTPIGQVLHVSGLKTLVTGDQYFKWVKSLLYLDHFRNIYSKMKTNIRL